MNIEDLKNELIEIAMKDPLEQEMALNLLKDACNDANLDQTMGSLRAGLKSLTRVAQETASMPVVAEISKDWFLINAEGSVRYTRWEDDELCFYKKADFGAIVAPLTGMAQGRRPEDVYLQSGDRREYKGITIDASAGPIVDNKINLWQGYGVEPADGDVTPFTNYLQTVFPDEWEYILNWCAWVVQNPDDKPKVALFLISRVEGTGKSTLGVILRQIFGRHAVVASKTDDLVGRFGGHLAQALFVHGDEILFRGNKQGADRLKTMITDDTIRLEPKGVKSFEMVNNMAFLFTSNHEHAAHVGPSDRRYAFSEAVNTLVGKEAYWDGFYKWLHDGGFEIIAAHLLGMDVSGFHPKRDRPFSNMYLINKRGSLEQVGKWWRQCIDAEEILGNQGHFIDDDWLDKKALYQAYVRHERHQKGRDDTVDAKLFWKDMRAMGAIADDKRPKVDGEQVRQVKLIGWDAADEALFTNFR